MSAPFIALTMPAQGAFEAQPIFINAAQIRSVNPRWLRRPGENGGREAHDIVGTWICTGDGEEGTFPVTESYGEVTGAIREALS